MNGAVHSPVFLRIYLGCSRMGGINREMYKEKGVVEFYRQVDRLSEFVTDRIVHCCWRQQMRRWSSTTTSLDTNQATLACQD